MEETKSEDEENEQISKTQEFYSEFDMRSHNNFLSEYIKNEDTETKSLLSIEIHKENEKENIVEIHREINDEIKDNDLINKNITISQNLKTLTLEDTEEEKSTLFNILKYKKIDKRYFYNILT